MPRERPHSICARSPPSECPTRIGRAPSPRMPADILRLRRFLRDIRPHVLNTHGNADTKVGLAAALGLKPLARIKAFASAGVDPAIMGTGPIPATQKCLQKAGWSIDDLDLIESNEAFAAQALSVGKELGWDSDKVNVNGGACALGHPIGCSGARVLVTLIHALKARGLKRGVASLCIGGGEATAMAIEV